MSEAVSTAEFDAGARGALALLALISAPGRQTKVAARPEAAAPGAFDDYERGAAEARRLLGVMAPPAGAGETGAPRRSTAEASDLSHRSAADDDPHERAKGAAEAQLLLGIKIVGEGARSGRSV
jgi:hypothetical protein